MAVAAGPVFISYARLDQPLVTRAVEFLRAGGLNVFVDSQSIAYGTDWRQALADAIESAERVMLFWTAAAAASRWVTREWKLALKRGKKVVPTLLDDTPLPPALARLQAVSTLRGLFPAPVRRPQDLAAEPLPPGDDGDDEDAGTGASGSTWSGLDAPSRFAAPSAPRAGSPRLGLIVASLAVVGVVSGLFLAVPHRGSEQPAPTAVATPASSASSAELPVQPPPASSSASASAPAAVEPALFAFDGSPLALLLALVLMTGPAWWLLQRRSQRGRARAVVQEVYAV